MVGSKYYNLLTAIYVDRLSKYDIIKNLKMSDEGYENNKKIGEYKLKDALLRSTCPFELDILRDKSTSEKNISFDIVADLSECCKSKIETNPFSDVFGAELTDGEISEKTMAFLYKFPEILKWNQRDCYVWRKRYLENASPEVVAKDVNCTRSWVDTRYSRLNKRFQIAIRRWWNINVV